MLIALEKDSAVLICETDLDKKMKSFYWQMNNLTVVNPMGEAVETYTLDAQERIESVTNLQGQQLDVTYLVGNLASSINRFDGVMISNVFKHRNGVVY